MEEGEYNWQFLDAEGQMENSPFHYSSDSDGMLIGC